MALWGGRFTRAADQRFKQFNDSLRFDYRLAEQDIVGSVAGQSHGNGRRVNRRRAGATGRGAERVAGRCSRQPQQILESDAEDIHSWVEGKLIDKVGQLGKSCIPGVAVMIR